MAALEGSAMLVGPYRILDRIGTGTFSCVFRGFHTRTLCAVALKAIAKASLPGMEEFELFRREANLLKLMDHPFIAPLFEVVEDSHYFYLVMELIDCQDLLSRITANKALSENESRHYFFQLLTVLDYLHHDKHIMHRDIKAENILIDHNGNIRIIDFGFAKSFCKARPFMETACGSAGYVSPEIIREQPYTTATDLWSAGVVLYAMTVGRLPFQGASLRATFEAICGDDPEVPSSVSPELKSLLASILAKNPLHRITTEGALNHPWLAGYDKQQFRGITGPECAELDDTVAAEMRALGYDTAGLAQELKKAVINPRTAAYKMLKRKKTVDGMSDETRPPGNKPLPILARRGSNNIRERTTMIRLPALKPGAKQGCFNRLLTATVTP
jgi:serine/threonine protein kinase